MRAVPSKTLQQILDEAQTLPPHERLRFIREACATDSKLYASAMHELESRQQWFGTDGADAPQSAQDEAVDLTGERIGHYRIVRSLGRGGMGEVFLADRADEQFQQQVAIKLVRRGLLSRQIQGRLKLERQILATLDHPNIARLFDGGTTTDGTPYIVMEYVDGEPIDIYCDSRCLSIEQRLRLFQIVCSAVHRAHQNLIVHRDLKPSNIMVARDGTPKLLDFGIAKMLDDRHMMHTMAVTQHDYRVLTPDHASPEQIRGDLITTASDTYVLGVVLYELLCGCKPFTLQGNRLGELERAICEETPPLPSVVIQAREDAAGIARQRGTSPARLRRELAGDLDNIVLMAMRKEAERRYSSVEQFAADVQRHLDGMPVLARADAWSYRAGKFLARHALVTGLAAAFLAVLIGFSITTYIQSGRIAQERDVAQGERARAQTAQRRAEAVSDLLIESFRLADPSHARGKDITAREILDQGAALARDLSAQPDLQATVLDTIGSVYLSLDLPADAQPLIEQGLAVRRKLYGEQHLDVASSLYSLNRVYEKKGDLKTAEALAVDSLAINSLLTGSESEETAGSLCRLGVIQHARGDQVHAEQHLNECLRLRIARYGPNHELVTVPLDNLARLAQDRRDLDAAERLYRAAIDIDERNKRLDHPQYIRHLHNLATALHGKGDLDGAEPLYRKALGLYRQVLGPAHSETVAAACNLGRLLMDRGRFDEAQQAYDAALTATRKAHGNEPHVDIGYLLADFGRLDFERKRYREAEAHYREALRNYQATLPPGHGYTAAALTMLGRTLIELRRPQEAEETLQAAMKEWSKEYGVSSPWYAQTRAFLGRAWALQRRFPEAEAALTETYPVLVRSQLDAEMTSTVRGWIEELYRSTGRPPAGAGLLPAGGDPGQRGAYSIVL